jgi:PiT family inorganic phosphate transporter
MFMNDSTLSKIQISSHPHLHHKPSFITLFLFSSLLILGLLFTIYSLMCDVGEVHLPITVSLPFILLAIALLMALVFEFVNGFHDTANAVATVIYTHSLPPNFAVLWSGIFNFLGVLFSSGAVAFGIISLLPVELILESSSGADFAMVFALLIAAVLWNLGTWWFGLPASSSHTLIGSLIGVNATYALMHGRTVLSGVDFGQVTKVGYSLLLSPLIGFVCAALLFWALRALVKTKELYQEPVDNAPPPWWIRSVLILTCTGVSFVHGSNDGQKGMGLIMLILIGTIPTAYSLNRTLPASYNNQFVSSAQAAQQTLSKNFPINSLNDNPTLVLSNYVKTKQVTPELLPALAAVTDILEKQFRLYGSINQTPVDVVTNLRTKMYLAAETIRLIEKDKNFKLDSDSKTALKAFKTQLDSAVKFIPVWVKIVVAIALGLGTMAGWKRIVITVGEKIGKTRLTYAQGASAELVAVLTIGAADVYGLPVSTTQVVSSGVAGTMAANKSGLQVITLRNLLLAWVLTLPAAMFLSGLLYWLFSQLF